MARPKLRIARKKIMLLLLGGIALGFSYSPTRYRRVFKSTAKEWQWIEHQELYRTIRRLYQSQLVEYQEHPDGSIAVTLSKGGREVALHYKLDEITIPVPKQWDKKWRIVLFDIPEKQKKLRNEVRSRLRQFGFIELQKSVFVHPFECANEIDFLVEIYDARQYVRFVEANTIDNELHLKKKFCLI